jgi:hypothetical protein
VSISDDRARLAEISRWGYRGMTAPGLADLLRMAEDGLKARAQVAAVEALCDKADVPPKAGTYVYWHKGALRADDVRAAIAEAGGAS